MTTTNWYLTHVFTNKMHTKSVKFENIIFVAVQKLRKHYLSVFHERNWMDGEAKTMQINSSIQNQLTHVTIFMNKFRLTFVKDITFIKQKVIKCKIKKNE